MEKRSDEGDNAFRCAYEILVTILDNASYVKRNRRLLHDAVAVTIKAARSHNGIDGAGKRMKKGKSRGQIARVLEGLDPDMVEGETNSILREDAKKRFGRPILDSAIGVHAISHYGIQYRRKSEVGRSKPKDGTTRFYMVATVYAIGKGGKRFTLAMTFVPLGTTMRSVIQTLLHLLRRCDADVDILLLDRGSYSIDVVRLMMRLNIDFVIQMKGKRLEKKRRGYSTAYVMKSVEDWKPVSQLVGAVSVIWYNNGRRFGHHGTMQPCFMVYRST